MKTQTTLNRQNELDNHFWQCRCESENILHVTMMVCPFCDCDKIDGEMPSLEAVVTDQLKKRKAGKI